MSGNIVHNIPISEPLLGRHTYTCSIIHIHGSNYYHHGTFWSADNVESVQANITEFGICSICMPLCVSP